MAETAAWRCPVCGGALIGERLEVEEDDGGLAAVYVIDCPRGHLHLAVTESDLVRFTGDLVLERLKRG